MANDSGWFIRERSEALASLLLTSRADVHVRDQRDAESGVDLMVEVIEPDRPLSPKPFVVQVRGTLSSDKKQWMEGVKQLLHAGPFYLPTCVFVVNVRDSQAAFAWLAEPQVVNQSAKLTFFEQGELHPLDEKAVDEIVGRVQQWYDALPQPVASHAR